MLLPKRFDVTPIIELHYRGLRAPSGKLQWAEAVWLFWIPCTLGAAAAIFSIKVASLGPLLTATSLLIGVMLSLFVFMTNLRIKIFETESLNYKRDLQRLVGSVATASLYVALTAMVATVDLALTSSVEFEPLSGTGWRRLGTGLLAVILSHLAVTIFSIIRRIFLIYHYMFQVDFSADLSPVEDEVKPTTRRAG